MSRLMHVVLHAWRARSGPPLVVRVGGVALAVGLAVDIGAHLVASPDAHGHIHSSPAQLVGHLVVLAGMVIVLAGVVVDGARRQRRVGHDRQ